MSRFRGLALVVGAPVTAVVILGVLLGLSGYDPWRVLATLWDGSVGTWYSLTSATLVRCVPLTLTGLAVALAFRAGVWNIGADGQLLIGAAGATGVGLGLGHVSSPLALVLALLAGAVAGGLWAAIAALLRARFSVLEVISTIMLNFVAVHLVGAMVRGPLQEPTHAYPQSPPLPDAMHMPLLLQGSRLHAGIVIALVASIASWWFLRATAAGFRLRATGLNPSAARIAGEIDVARVQSLALIASGTLAGLAGAIEVTGVTFALYEDLSPGYGYTAVAVALLAELQPLAVLGSALLFAALESGGLAMQRDAGVPAVLVSVVEALVILGVLVLGRLSWGGRTGLFRGPAPQTALEART